MKIKLFFFLCFSISLFGQNQNLTSQINEVIKNETKHELKFNFVYTLLSIPEITYERTVNRKSSFGLSLSYTIDQDHLDIDYMITPFYRYYLGKNKPTGMYIEGNVTYFKESSKYLTPALSKTDISIGGGIGYKILKRNGFVLDFTAGLGRVLTKEDNFFTDYTPRFGISLGKRFSVSSDDMIEDRLRNEEDVQRRRNEIRLNLLHLSVGFPEISYERYLNNNSSIGLSISYSLSDKFYEQYFITPNYRFYLGDISNSNFFTEIGVICWKENFESDTRISKFTGLGGEFGLGYKINKISNYPIEILVGFGRSFINQNYLENWFVPRIGVSIGKNW